MGKTNGTTQEECIDKSAANTENDTLTLQDARPMKREREGERDER